MNKAFLWHIKTDHSVDLCSVHVDTRITLWLVIDLNKKHCTTLWRQRSMCSTGFGTKHYFTILLTILNEPAPLFFSNERKKNSIYCLLEFKDQIVKWWHSNPRDEYKLAKSVWRETSQHWLCFCWAMLGIPVWGRMTS